VNNFVFGVWETKQKNCAENRGERHGKWLRKERRFVKGEKTKKKGRGVVGGEKRDM